MQLLRSLWMTCLLLALTVPACNSTSDHLFTPTDGAPAAFDAGNETDGYVWDLPQPDIYVNPNVSVVDVEPDHGPFAGGNTVVVRGSNFTASATVTFGGVAVLPANITLTDSHSLTVIPPAGAPGNVDVVVTDSGMTATLPMGYHYDSLYPNPNTGSTAGGDQINILGLGTHFSNQTAVTMEGLPCTIVQVVDAQNLTCVTPPNLPGPSDVTVVTGSENIAVPNAFTYTEDTSTISGALGGGPINGTINVIVLSGGTGDPIQGAYVFLGDDPTVSPPQSGVTDASGRLTFSFSGLTGPIDLTASAHCFSAHTMQAFNAADVLIYLYPEEIAACAMGSPPGSDSGEVYASEISGELVWAGFNEYSPNPWNNIPLPRAGERHVAYVYTTQSDILTPNPAPGDGGTVFEVVAPGYSGLGYPYDIIARPAALAVYAIAGIENIQTQAFTPYIMGVARAVLANPQARVVNVDIPMNITLNHETPVTFHGLPTPVNNQPDTMQVQAFIDLGGEGVIARTDNIAVGTDPTAVFYVVAMPGLTGSIADAAEILEATYGTTTSLIPPYTTTVVAGITDPDDTEDLTTWVGIPDFTEPFPNGLLPNDRTVQFTLNGADPDVFWMNLSGTVFYWETFAPGSARTFMFPNLSTIPGLADLPTGQSFYMNVTGINVPSLTFNNFQYDYLEQLYWSSYSMNTLLWAL